MHAVQLLHKFFEKSAQIHKKRLIVLFSAVESLARGNLLTLSGLGRSMPGKTKVKHCIKRMDRLLGNEKLHTDRFTFYQLLAKHIVGKIKRPIVLIDWSQLGDNDKFYFISASIPYGGRSLTLYEESCPRKLYDTHSINKEFLLKLKKIIPPTCKPIIVTDAGTGFRSPWFKEIANLGWDFVGRIRGGKTVLIGLNGKWISCSNIYVYAQKYAKYLGQGLLTKRSQFVCEFFMAKRMVKKRSDKSEKLEINYESNDRKYSRRVIEPWLLATSLDPKLFSANNIIAIYKQRMQIEELFRDMKNQRIGFGLKKTMSRNVDRLNILLLIGTIANYVMFIIGKTAKVLSLEHQFQSNSIKYKAVISIFNLGRQIYLFRKVKIPIKKMRETLALTSNHMIHARNFL